MKSMTKKLYYILITLLIILVVICFVKLTPTGNVTQKSQAESSSSDLPLPDASDITATVNFQKQINDEYEIMEKQTNMTEFATNGVTYLGPSSTTEATASVFIKSTNDKIYKYNIYKQNASYETYETYMAFHGCSACALTTLLNATVPELADHTPDKIISEVQKSVFGEEVFNKNFNKKMKNQMPVTMYGITQILDEYKIEHKFVYKFDNNSAITEITEHLKTGNPVMITLRRKNGNTKWAGTVHTLLLIGLDPDGNAIVCDSANKLWSGINQRVKFGSVEELVKFMWSSNELSTSAYYDGRKGTSGYILIY